MSTILLATDGSLPALAATVRAVAEAKQRSATLVILRVVEQSPMTSLELASESAALQRPEGEDGIEYAKELAALDGNGPRGARGRGDHPCCRGDGGGDDRAGHLVA